MGAVDDVFENFIQRRPHVDMAIGIGRAVMEDILRLPFRLRALFSIEVNAVPTL